MPAPNKLYKYCSINSNTISGICQARVYHSPPILFNDPLDCSPTFIFDISSDELRELVEMMLEMNGLPKNAIQKSIDGMAAEAVGETDETLRDYDNRFIAIMKAEVGRQLQTNLGSSGVLCLSETWNNPLLWSHYGDQHKGICIEYDITNYDNGNLRRVDYNAPRSVRLNDLYRWYCKDDQRAAERVRETFYYAKAPAWAYEKEWREVSHNAGINNSKFRITAIHIGLRAEFIWRWVLVKLLNQNKDVALYQIKARDENFELIRHRLNRSELESRGIDIPENGRFRAFGKSFAESMDSKVLDEVAQALAGSGNDPADIWAGIKMISLHKPHLTKHIPGETALFEDGLSEE